MPEQTRRDAVKACRRPTSVDSQDITQIARPACAK
jgi:hypothetical protein